jgi:hypothetical protein
MTDLDHYGQARDALATAERGGNWDPQDLAIAQLHAMLAVADELRRVLNELTIIRDVATRLT